MNHLPHTKKCFFSNELEFDDSDKVVSCNDIEPCFYFISQVINKEKCCESEYRMTVFQDDSIVIDKCFKNYIDVNKIGNTNNTKMKNTDDNIFNNSNESNLNKNLTNENYIIFKCNTYIGLNEYFNLLHQFVKNCGATRILDKKIIKDLYDYCPKLRYIEANFNNKKDRKTFFNNFKNLFLNKKTSSEYIFKFFTDKNQLDKNKIKIEDLTKTATEKFNEKHLKKRRFTKCNLHYYYNLIPNNNSITNTVGSTIPKHNINSNLHSVPSDSLISPTNPFPGHPDPTTKFTDDHGNDKNGQDLLKSASYAHPSKIHEYVHQIFKNEIFMLSKNLMTVLNDYLDQNKTSIIEYLSYDSLIRTYLQDFIIYSNSDFVDTKNYNNNESNKESEFKDTDIYNNAYEIIKRYMNNNYNDEVKDNYDIKKKFYEIKSINDLNKNNLNFNIYRPLKKFPFLKVFEYNNNVIKQICLNIKKDEFTEFILINEKFKKDKLLDKKIIKFKSYDDLCQDDEDIKISLIVSVSFDNKIQFSKNRIFGRGIIKNGIIENEIINNDFSFVENVTDKDTLINENTSKSYLNSVVVNENFFIKKNKDLNHNISEEIKKSIDLKEKCKEIYNLNLNGINHLDLTSNNLNDTNTFSNNSKTFNTGIPCFQSNTTFSDNLTVPFSCTIYFPIIFFFIGVISCLILSSTYKLVKNIYKRKSNEPYDVKATFK